MVAQETKAAYEQQSVPSVEWQGSQQMDCSFRGLVSRIYKGFKSQASRKLLIQV